MALGNDFLTGKANFKKADLLSVDDLSDDDISNLMQISREMKKILQRDIRKVPTLRGKTLVNAFFEPSTRTRISFEIAGKTLSADVVNFSSNLSSMKKGESVFDTIKTLENLGADFIAIRSPTECLPHFVAKYTSASVINAGDGKNEHPTQALLDLFSILEKFNLEEPKDILGLRITFVGDVLHSRVAHSGVKLFSRLGAKISICSPLTLLPRSWEGKFQIFPYISNDVFENSDVLIFLRIQTERHSGKFIPDEREYQEFWGLDEEKLKSYGKKNFIIMHPGPVRWGVELMPSLVYSEISLIPEQVVNGVAVRMAVLYFLFTKRAST